jgi:hypothetical protein
MTSKACSFIERKKSEAAVEVHQLGRGLPDGIFSNAKNPNLGKFGRVLQWKILVYFTYGRTYFMAIW